MTEPYLIPQDKLPEKYIAIHTTDRNLFRRCRRKWNYQSSLKQNLTLKDKVNPNLWFGTGFHFALEDYHGYNKFGNPKEAFKAYVECFDARTLDLDCQALIPIGYGMLDHYVNNWLPRRNEYQTFIVDDVPQVEIEISIYIPELSEKFEIPVLYQLKLDRVVIDNDRRLWFQDYKTAAKFDTKKLVTDPQISGYSWAFPYKYNKVAEGITYTQFKKAVAEEPRILKNGDISTAKGQNTTYEKYLKALKDKYGPITIPPKYQEVLDILLEAETPEGDNFIRYDKVTRNDFNRVAEYKKVLAEGAEMLNANLNLYSNPTRDCSWDCDFLSVCLAEDDGSDFKFILNNEFEEKKEEDLSWQKKIKYPQ